MTINDVLKNVFSLVKSITGDVDVKGKGTLQKQIDDLFQSASDGKKKIADAITGKGVTTSATATFQTMADNIGKITTAVAAKLQSKTVSLDTSTTSTTVKPDTGYNGLSQVTASITTQTKTASLKTSSQDITPDSGKVLSKVTVPKVTGNATAGNVLSGKTFCSESGGVGATGSMTDKSSTTVDAGSVTRDSSYTYFSVGTAGYYNTSSKLRAANSNSNLGVQFVSSANNSALSTSFTSVVGAYYMILRLTTSTSIKNDTFSGCSIIYDYYLDEGNNLDPSIRSRVLIVKATSTTITYTKGNNNTKGYYFVKLTV